MVSSGGARVMYKRRRKRRWGGDEEKLAVVVGCSRRVVLLGWLNREDMGDKEEGGGGGLFRLGRRELEGQYGGTRGGCGLQTVTAVDAQRGGEGGMAIEREKEGKRGGDVVRVCMRLRGER